MPRHLLLLNALAILWCCLLLNIRMAAAGHHAYIFMLWNLFLALVPLGLSLALKRVRHTGAAVVLLCLWLLFFPNAPYVLTDLIHLNARPHRQVPQWLDLVMLLSFALVSLWLGFQSLRQVQHWLARRFSPAIGWLAVVLTLLLSGFGVYLGRFLRWNSWDLFHRPEMLLRDILTRVIAPEDHLQTWGFTLGFAVLLILGYFFWLASIPASMPAPAEEEG